MKQKIEKEESQLKSCQFECDLLISKEEGCFDFIKKNTYH